ncbi:hypothetical protein SAY87_023584 [Trapa incisa]|uniref:Wall-associated receptor kinase galacturonan-binding domain-containing protein n=1 Tax=Trapa incisa TaxID=236973 RepID=A0AAN7QUD8_9MYRT|nr:hypothetical protein SAY87_023584 [Trapa incisa]
MSISCRITVGAILAVLAAFSSSSSSSQPVTPAGCPSSCGEVTIPYPFGLSEDCYLNPSFLITCNDTFSPPKPFLRKSNIEVANISLEGELRIYTYVGSSCKNNQSGDWTTNSTISKTQLSSFSFSTTKNRFTAVGCDTLATVTILNGDNSSSGCLSMCNNYDSVSQGSCDGFGCCQTAIPKNIRNYTISVGTYRNFTDVWVSIPCSHVFIAEEASFKFSKDNLTNMQPHEFVPTVVDWAVWNEACAGASEISSSYACKADNSLCYDPQDINGYRCNCSQGYRGNPYMTNGCQGEAERDASVTNRWWCQRWDNSATLLRWISVLLDEEEESHKAQREIVEDSNVKSDDDAQQVKEVAMPAKRCLRMRGDERPTMKEVAMKLEGIRVMAQHPWVAVELNHEETHNLLGEAFKSLDHAYTSTTNESMMDQLLPSMSGGR